MTELKITSPAIEPEAWIPNCHSGFEEDFSPELHIEGIDSRAVVEQPFHMEQGLAYGRHCYRGPKPPFNCNHRYCFTIYVLDTMLDISTNSDKAAVLKAMDGHILQTGFLYGKYQRKHK